MRTIVTIISLAVSMTVYAQKDKYIHFHWHDNSNGNQILQPSDLKYSEKGRFYYYFSNDKVNIYIDLRVFEKEVQRQILASGLSVWIDMDGKKAKKTGLRYPARMKNQGRPDMTGMANQQSPRNQQAPQNNQQQGNIQGMKNPRSGAPGGDVNQRGGNMQMPAASKIELIGLAGSDHSYISSDEINNFMGSMRFDKEGNLWYELIIPMSKIPARSPGKKKDDNSFILGFSYPGIMTQRMGGGPGSGTGDYGRGMDEGGGMSRSGGGGRGMGRPGGGMGRSGGGMGRYGGGGRMEEASTSPVIVWFKNIQLASER
jgi:hypothetical protein